MRLLPRLFLAFPPGFAGVALLLLRLVVGVSFAFHGAVCLKTTDPSSALVCNGVFEVLTGAMLSVGFLTPFAGVAAAAYAISVRLNLLSDASAPVFAGSTAFSFGLAILLAIVAQGPGAYSIDARLFGRREIIIPRANHRSESH